LYQDNSGIIIGLNTKLNRLIKATEEAIEEMDKTGRYTPEVRAKLLEAIEKARPKAKGH
jgi:predicted alternative tryptophan synthase beta-subunit